MARPRVLTTWRPASSRPSRRPSSGSWSTPTGAILRGAPPPMHWRDAHIWLSPKVPGSARLDDYRPIALGQLDMKLLTGPLTQRIT